VPMSIGLFFEGSYGDEFKLQPRVEDTMLRNRGSRKPWIVLATLLLAVPIAKAQTIGDYGNIGAFNISFELDGTNATNEYVYSTGPDVTGSPVTVGTQLSGWVTWAGVECSGCSANISCYSALDQLNQYQNVTIFSIDTTQSSSAGFSWTPTSPGTYYINCDINYYNNPYLGSLASALTQHIVITVT
jgi:hypothetical protein